MDTYFDVSATDRVLLNLLPSADCGSFVLVAEFDRQLDTAALRAAWYETLRRHPILTCTRPEDGGTRWEQSSGASGERPLTAWVSIEHIGRGSRLRLGIDHAAMDGRSGFYVIETLQDRYRFRSETRSADHAPRTFGGVVAETGFPHVRANHAVRASQGRWARLPASRHVRDEGGEAAEGSEALRVRLSADATTRLVRVTQSTGTPMTPMLAAAASVAWERASAGDGSDRASGWLVSNDLRPRLGYSGGLGNLSGMDAISFNAGAANLREAIASAKRSYAEVGRAGHGLASQVLAERAAALVRVPGARVSALPWMRAAMSRARYTRIMANLGAVPVGLIDWADAQMNDFYVIPAFKGLAYEPFSVSSFGGSLSVIVRLAGSPLRGAFFARLRGALEETFAEVASLEAVG